MVGRRTRIDSAAAANATMVAATQDLSPPKHLKLRRGDRPFWDAVIAERARSEWTDADLAVAAQLTRAMADAERISSIAVGAGGYVNERLVMLQTPVLDKISRRVVTLRRALGIDSRSKHGEQRDVDRRRAIAKDIESGLDVIGNSDDDLLAGAPTIQ